MSEKETRDDEMPSDQQKPGIGSDGKFHVPSNWDPATHDAHDPSRERWRIGLGVLAHFFRGDELLVEVDFTDFSISGSIADQANRDNYLNQIKIDAPVIAMKTSMESGQGGLKAGDIFQIDIATGDIGQEGNDLPIHRQILTEEDIALIKKRLEEESAMSPQPMYTSPE